VAAKAIPPVASTATVATISILAAANRAIIALTADRRSGVVVRAVDRGRLAKSARTLSSPTESARAPTVRAEARRRVRAAGRADLVSSNCSTSRRRRWRLIVGISPRSAPEFAAPLCIGDLYLICSLRLDPAMQRLKPSVGRSADRSGSLAEYLPGCGGV
jgi:hypothetical protein